MAYASATAAKAFVDVCPVKRSDGRARYAKRNRLLDDKAWFGACYDRDPALLARHAPPTVATCFSVGGRAPVQAVFDSLALRS